MMNGKKVLISGRVTDFGNDPLENAVVEIKNTRFDAIYRVNTNSNGEYKIFAEKGSYLALVAYKDYRTKFLEYWAWSIPAYQDLQLNPRIGGIEVYAMNAFIPQGAYPSFIVYFRPMSLKRAQEAGGLNALKKMKVADISPELSEDDIELKINGAAVKILEINRVKEYSGGIGSLISYLIQSTMPRKSIIAYLIQSALPLMKSNGKRYLECKIEVALRDKKTREKGEGCLFWRKQKHA